MKIVVINGDPNKKGATPKMLEAYIEGAQVSQDHDVSWYDIAHMRLLPCDECDACKGGRITGCIIKDDMTPVYKDIEAADLLLLGFPIVRWHLPGKLKMLIDRLYAMNLSALKEDNKKIAYLCTYRYEDLAMSGVDEVASYFTLVSQVMNFEVVHANHFYHCDERGMLNPQIITEIKTCSSMQL